MLSSIVGRRKPYQVFILLQGLGSYQLNDHLVNENNQGPYLCQSTPMLVVLPLLSRTLLNKGVWPIPTS